MYFYVFFLSDLFEAPASDRTAVTCWTCRPELFGSRLAKPDRTERHRQKRKRKITVGPLATGQPGWASLFALDLLAFRLGNLRSALAKPTPVSLAVDPRRIR